MKFLCAIVLKISLISISFADNLKFMTVIYRHGERSPIYIYPTDPHPPTFWTHGLGQLTNLGKNQSYQLGKFIRHRYRDFLPSTFNTTDIHVVSSDVDRTLMSAYCVLAGLYEPFGNDVWLESMKWQPIPVHSIPRNHDNLILNNVTCPKHEDLLNDHVILPNSKLLEKYQKIVNKILEKSGVGWKLSHPKNILLFALSIYDLLSVEEKHGLGLPEWTKEFYPEPLREITKFAVAMNTYDVPMKRLRCGPLLKDMIKHMEDVVEGRSKLKMWQYSGHDNTVIDILQCLNVYDGDLVPCASAVFFELHETVNKKFDIVIVYKKGDEVRRLEIPNCEVYCHFNSFKRKMADVLPANWEDECKLNTNEFFPVIRSKALSVLPFKFLTLAASILFLYQY